MYEANLRVPSLCGLAVLPFLLLAVGCSSSDEDNAEQTPQQDAGVEAGEADAQPDAIPESGTDTGEAGEDSGPEPLAQVGEGCWVDDDCEGDAICWDVDDEGFPGGMCVIEDCTQDSCPEGSGCFEFTDGVSRCIATCASNDDCRVGEGYLCDEHDTCWPGTGTVPPGGSCSDPTQCQGGDDAYCFDSDGYVGGYCIIVYCTEGSCPEGSECRELFSSGSSAVAACVPVCTEGSECREGYQCYEEVDSEADHVCLPWCEGDEACPGLYGCRENECVDVSNECTPTNPYGECPEGSWCDEGVCNSEPFACDGDDALEPNDAQADAVDAPVGTTDGLTICDGDEDWFRVEVPAGTIAKVGIQFQHAQGDLDLVVYDEAGELVGSRLGPIYPYSQYREYETGSEYYGLYSQNGGSVYYLRAVGYDNATAAYGLEVTHIPYEDGSDCEGAGYTTDECVGTGANGSGLLPFPFPDPEDTYVGEGYQFDTFGNYRFGRREVIMAVRYALHETTETFGAADALGLVDFADITGTTPGYDVGDPRHPESTHDQGGNIDIAYWQTDGSNDADIICNDGSVHNDGYCSSAAVDSHVVDLERQAFFMAKLQYGGRLRVIGVDQVIAPLIEDAADALGALPDGDPKKLTSVEVSTLKSKMAYGSGWPYHHHHIHVSYQWWGRSLPPSSAQSALPLSLFRVNPAQQLETRSLFQTWTRLP